MFEAQEGIRALLGALPTGSSRADAVRFHRKMRQLRRTPCSFLDEELGIVRDRSPHS